MNLSIACVALVVVLATFGLHYLTLSQLSRSLHHHGHKPLAMLGYIILLFGAHLIEIALYAGAYAFLAKIFGEPLVSGEALSEGVDYFYFSIVNYTSLGYGDLYPHRPFRVIAGIEALNGLMLITWSASFTFLAMSRLWR